MAERTVLEHVNDELDRGPHERAYGDPWLSPDVWHRVTEQKETSVDAVADPVKELEEDLTQARHGAAMRGFNVAGEDGRSSDYTAVTDALARLDERLQHIDYVFAGVASAVDRGDFALIRNVLMAIETERLAYARDAEYFTGKAARRLDAGRQLLETVRHRNERVEVLQRLLRIGDTKRATTAELEATIMRLRAAHSRAAAVDAPAVEG